MSLSYVARHTLIWHPCHRVIQSYVENIQVSGHPIKLVIFYFETHFAPDVIICESKSSFLFMHEGSYFKYFVVQTYRLVKYSEHVI